MAIIATLKSTETCFAAPANAFASIPLSKLAALEGNVRKMASRNFLLYCTYVSAIPSRC